jgi:hypothetical protein
VIARESLIVLGTEKPVALAYVLVAELAAFAAASFTMTASVIVAVATLEAQLHL